MDLITPSFGIIFWQTITFLVVLFILSKFAWKPILQILNQREEYIENALKNAEEAKQVLDSMKKEQDQLLENSNREREKIINQALNSKHVILEAAKLEASQLKESILKEARETIDTEKKIAFTRLNQEIILISTQLAEKLLKRELNTENKQEELVHKLIREIHLN